MTSLSSKTNKIQLLSLMLFVASLFSTGPASAQITVFPECNFIGAAVTLPEGDYTTNELRQMGVADNSIASIIVSEGYGAQLFLEDRFAGSSGKLVKMTPCLENTRYFKNISSLSVFGVDQYGNPLAGDAGSDPLAMDEPPASVVELFSECYFEGRSISVEAGEFSSSQLAQLGLADNTISSIRVPKGMSIQLFENDFFRGRSGKLGANSDCLVERFNNQVSSVIVSGSAEATQGAQLPTQASPELPPVLVYNQCNFAGQGARLPVGEYMAKDLAALGLADNTIASIRVPEGMQALIYENDFFRGRSTRVATSAQCLRGSQFENIISSITVLQSSNAVQKPLVNSNAPTDRVTIFTDCKFKGRFAELPEGEYSARDLKAMGFADNTISAIKVASGMTVTVFENDLYRGGNLELNEDESCLTTRRANDAISSLIVKKRETDKPFVSVLSAADKQLLNQGLQCVEPYVEKNLCNTESWNVIRNFCSLDKVSLMDDGYLENHVNNGNCTVKNWPVLVQRISDPSLR